MVREANEVCLPATMFMSNILVTKYSKILEPETDNATILKGNKS
jgi:hypothetical protein